MITEANDRELCVCSHELRLHSREADGTRGLCIKDEWCHCPGFAPQYVDEEIPPPAPSMSPAMAETWGRWAEGIMEQIGDE